MKTWNAETQHSNCDVLFALTPGGKTPERFPFTTLFSNSLPAHPVSDLLVCLQQVHSAILCGSTGLAHSGAHRPTVSLSSVLFSARCSQNFKAAVWF
jgi:hypothetical protein